MYTGCASTCVTSRVCEQYQEKAGQMQLVGTGGVISAAASTARHLHVTGSNLLTTIHSHTVCGHTSVLLTHIIHSFKYGEFQTIIDFKNKVHQSPTI